MNILIALLFSYCLGSVNPAYIICRCKGFDIRTVGSGNAGASNVKTQLGWGYFFFVAVFDGVKSFSAVMFCKYVFHVDYPIQMIGGCLAVIGHMFPFYLGFRGGKGFACYIGLSVFLDVKVFIFIILGALVLAILTNYIVTATMILTVALPVYSLVVGKEMFVCVALIITSLIIVIKHKDNFYRLLTKSETGINGKHIGFHVLDR